MRWLLTAAAVASAAAAARNWKAYDVNDLGVSNAPTRSDRRNNAQPLPPPAQRAGLAVVGEDGETLGGGPYLGPGSFWPMPASANVNPASCAALSPNFKFVVVGASTPVLDAAVQRYTAIVTTSFGPSNEPAQLPSTIPNITVTVADTTVDLAFKVDESYTVTVTVNAGPLSTAAITANTVWGALRAMETFAQMAQRNYTAPPSGGYYFACAATIVDAPRFPYRGLLIDVSRHFMNVTVLKSLVEFMAAMKMNAMHIHFTDDQSWPLVIESWPLLAGMGAFTPYHVYNKSDLADLAAYALNRGVIIIPEIEAPSHNSQMLNAYPDFGCLAGTPPNQYRCLIDPTNAQFFTFYYQMWAEMDAIFPKSWPFHIGGDEVYFGCWGGCPAAMAFANASGWDGNTRDIYNWVEQQMVAALKPLNRTLIGWEDIVGFPNGSFTQNGYANVWMEQWAGGTDWPWDSCDMINVNASMIVAGPYSILSTPAVNYAADITNLTCALNNYTITLVLGPELMLWDDAQNTDGADVLVDAMQSILAVAEPAWSQESFTALRPIDAGRYQDMRCRLLARLVPSHPWLPTGTYCMYEYPGVLPPWATT